MSNNDATEEISDDNEDNTYSGDEGVVDRKVVEAEEGIDKNPDVEDPRLFSPLQEPDRPAPDERTSEQTKDSKSSSD